MKKVATANRKLLVASGKNGQPCELILVSVMACHDDFYESAKQNLMTLFDCTGTIKKFEVKLKSHRNKSQQEKV